MLRKNTKYIIIGICCFLFLSVSFLFFYRYHYFTIKESPLYLTISGYRRDSGQLVLPEGVVYDDHSGENIFLEAVSLYIEENYSEAKPLFFQALDAKYTDPALVPYSYYFIVQCDYYLETGIDSEIVAKGLDAIAKYPPLANDTSILWNMISTVSFEEEKDRYAISLMENYLNTANGLELSTWAWLKNYIAMLEYNNEQYAKSIRYFYDVETTLSKGNLTPEAESELRYAKEYIANIHFAFKDYVKAAELYEEIITTIPESSQFDEFLACLNLASSYIESSNLPKAKETVDYLETKLENIDPFYQGEIIASMKDILANIALIEKDYSLADRYLTEAEEYYAVNEATDILGGKYFISLTRSKYFISQKQYDKALELLQMLVSSDSSAYYGFEHDTYELLKEIYISMGEYEKLIEVYDKLLTLDDDFEKTIQREYLEFSSYYKENNRLKAYNSLLARKSNLSFGLSIAVSLILIVALIIVKILTTKNVTDQLTGIYNRKKLNRLIKHFNRFGTPSHLAVIMMDIDYFKKYNDTYGHPEGDKVLKKIAKILSACVRKKDIVIRYGGEEFLLLVSGVSQETAENICLRIKNQINEANIEHLGSEITDHVTLSIGLCYQEAAKLLSFEALVERADLCLYRSKENGRNQITLDPLENR